jgi:hypothetical protein
MRLVFIAGHLRSVEDEFRYLSTLDTSAVGALGRALVLESDRAHSDFAHALLAKIAELLSVEHRRRHVEGLGLDLDWVLEKHLEGVARAVREELRLVFCKDSAEPLQLDFDIVVSRAVRGTIKTEANHEYPLVDAELDAVTAAPVAPLVVAVGARLEPVTQLQQAI